MKNLYESIAEKFITGCFDPKRTDSLVRKLSQIDSVKIKETLIDYRFLNRIIHIDAETGAKLAHGLYQARMRRKLNAEMVKVLKPTVAQFFNPDRTDLSDTVKLGLGTLYEELLQAFSNDKEQMCQCFLSTIILWYSMTASASNTQTECMGTMKCIEPFTATFFLTTFFNPPIDNKWDTIDSMVQQLRSVCTEIGFLIPRIQNNEEISKQLTLMVKHTHDFIDSIHPLSDNMHAMPAMPSFDDNSLVHIGLKKLHDSKIVLKNAIKVLVKAQPELIEYFNKLLILKLDAAIHILQTEPQQESISQNTKRYIYYHERPDCSILDNEDFDSLPIELRQIFVTNQTVSHAELIEKLQSTQHLLRHLGLQKLESSVMVIETTVLGSISPITEVRDEFRQNLKIYFEENDFPNEIIRLSILDKPNLLQHIFNQLRLSPKATETLIVGAIEANRDEVLGSYLNHTFLPMFIDLVFNSTNTDLNESMQGESFTDLRQRYINELLCDEFLKAMITWYAELVDNAVDTLVPIERMEYKSLAMSIRYYGNRLTMQQLSRPTLERAWETCESTKNKLSDLKTRLDDINQELKSTSSVKQVLAAYSSEIERILTNHEQYDEYYQRYRGRNFLETGCDALKKELTTTAEILHNFSHISIKVLHTLLLKKVETAIELLQHGVERHHIYDPKNCENSVFDKNEFNSLPTQIQQLLTSKKASTDHTLLIETLAIIPDHTYVISAKDLYRHIQSSNRVQDLELRNSSGTKLPIKSSESVSTETDSTASSFNNLELSDNDLWESVYEMAIDTEATTEADLMNNIGLSDSESSLDRSTVTPASSPASSALDNGSDTPNNSPSIVNTKHSFPLSEKKQKHFIFLPITERSKKIQSIDEQKATYASNMIKTELTSYLTYLKTTYSMQEMTTTGYFDAQFNYYDSQKETYISIKYLALVKAKIALTTELLKTLTDASKIPKIQDRLAAFDHFLLKHSNILKTNQLPNEATCYQHIIQFIKALLGWTEGAQTVKKTTSEINKAIKPFLFFSLHHDSVHDKNRCNSINNTHPQRLAT